MSTAAAGPSAQAVAAFARDAGRSASVIVRTATGTWHGGAADDTPRPAASLLKLGIAMAVERVLQVEPDSLPSVVRVGEILASDPSPSALRAIDAGIRLGPSDVLGLMIALSDNPCATWLAGAAGPDAVGAALSDAGIHDIQPIDPGRGVGPLTGRCTALQALALVHHAADTSRHPLTAEAMANVVHAARIPIGVNDQDIRVAHKTGSLAGVANDVAVIDCRGGARVTLAFLTEEQPDPLVTGYEMGLCTRRILDAWELGARTSRSLAFPTPFAGTGAV